MQIAIAFQRGPHLNGSTLLGTATKINDINTDIITNDANNQIDVFVSLLFSY